MKELNLPNNVFFFGEAFQQPRHNVLKYNSVPAGNVALFAAVHVPENTWLPYEDIWEWAELFGIGIVPLLQQGLFDKPPLETLEQLLTVESCLGGPNIEGIVVKNLHQDWQIGEQYVPFLTGKFVSEKFKEVHRNKSYGKSEKKGHFQELAESFKTEPRWEKSFQHLREAGKLSLDLPDIGLLVSEVHRDILEEESDNIKDALFRIFKGEILRTSTKGLAEWYKKKLVEIDQDS